MRPVLFDRHSTRSALGTLEDCISCSVTEEVNGIFECTFQYPMTGQYFEQLINYGGMVYAAHAHGTNGGYKADFFDIYKYSAPINGVVTFYAQHVSYRLASLIVNGGWTATSPDNLFTRIAANAVTDNEFTFTASGETFDAGEVSPIGYANARGLLLGKEEGKTSAVQAWRCEFVFDHWNVTVKKKRGTDNGVQIRYGKNLTNIQRDKDSGGIISAVFPYWQKEGVVVTAGGVVSDSMEAGNEPWTTGNSDEQMYRDYEPYYFRPAVLQAAAIDFSDKFETQPTAAELQQAAADYMRKNSTWRYDDNITIDFVDLYRAPEYADIRELEKCGVGDYVSVIYTNLGVVSHGVEIVSATYDTLAERYTQMQLGTIRTTLAQAIIQTIGGVYK